MRAGGLHGCGEAFLPFFGDPVDLCDDSFRQKNLFADFAQWFAAGSRAGTATTDDHATKVKVIQHILAGIEFRFQVL